MKSFLLSNKIWLWVCFGVLFVLGLVIRLYDLYEQPLDFNSTRQLHSAVIARGMYYQNLESAPQWQREMAVRRWQQEGLIEPPFLETLTAFTYRLAGKEILWAARLYSIIFWMAGSLAFFLLALEAVGTGGLVGVAYFLILPFGAIASRSFQPDPLMTSLIVFSLWAAVRWRRSPGWKWAIAAGLLGGLAILCKTVAVFFIGGAWVGLILAVRGLRKALADRQVWVIGFLTILPYAIFYVYGIYISGLLASQFDLRFFPNLWVDPKFYLQWVGQIAGTVGFEWFLVAFLCTFLVRERSLRWMMLGMWGGYFIYGMTLSFHISTHDYYQIPLIPLVALGLGIGIQSLIEQVQQPKKLAYLALAGVLLFAVTLKAWNGIVTLKRNDYSSEVRFWQKLGKSLGQDVSVIGLTQDYGYRLYIYGWVDSANWMRTNDFNYRELAGMQYDIQKLFKEQTDGKDYFIVTMMDELDNQPELKSILNSNYPVKEDVGGTLVFDLKHPLGK